MILSDKTLIINVAAGSNYVKKQKRLINSIKQFHNDFDYLIYSEKMPPNCPSHKDVPYAFKPYAMLEAKRLGYHNLFWLDTSLVLRKPMTPLIDYVKEHGHYIQVNGWNTGQWCTDAACKSLGIDREESFKMGHCMGTMLCLDISNKRSSDFLDQWYQYANDGVSFIGPWNNKDNLCSADKRVLGHRHDQTVASIVSLRIKMEWKMTEGFLSYCRHDEKPPTHALFSCNGGAWGL